MCSGGKSVIVDLRETGGGKLRGDGECRTRGLGGGKEDEDDGVD